MYSLLSCSTLVPQWGRDMVPSLWVRASAGRAIPCMWLKRPREPHREKAGWLVHIDHRLYLGAVCYLNIDGVFLFLFFSFIRYFLYLYFFFCVVFFPPSLLNWVFLIYISIVIPCPGFQANIPQPLPFPFYMGVPLPILPQLPPSPNNHVHWGFSLSRTQGFPFHWCPY